VHPKLFTYMRYNADLSASGLAALGLGHIRPHDVQQLDSVDCIPQLRAVGRAAARSVARDHFARFLGEATAVS
jgi:hypothetical protein